MASFASTKAAWTNFYLISIITVYKIKILFNVNFKVKNNLFIPKASTLDLLWQNVPKYIHLFFTLFLTLT